LETLVRIELEAPSREAAAVRDSLLRFRAPDGSFVLPARDLPELDRRGIRHSLLERIDASRLPVRFLPAHAAPGCETPPEEARLAVLARLLAEGRTDGPVHVRFLGRNRSVPADGFVLDRAGGGRRYVWQVVPPSEVEGGSALGERFAALRETFARRDTRVALSLGSGGVRMFAHAPALQLLDSIGLSEHVDEVWGTSAGALAGLLYAHGLSPQAIEQTGYDLYTGRYSLALAPSKFQLMRSLVREAFAGGQDPRLAGFVDCTQNLSRMLQHYCQSLRPTRQFFALAFDLMECRSQVLTPEAVPEHLEQLLVQTDAVDCALASSAVPVLFVPKTIQRAGGATSYIDGSTTEDVPLASVIRKWDLDRAAGAERRSKLLILYVKLTHGTVGFRASPKRMGKVRLLQTIASVGMDTMHRQSLALARARPDVRLLPLELSESTADFFELRRIPEYVRRAKEVFPAQLLAHERSLREEQEGELESSPPAA
jgi:hypothetical protein